MFAGQQVYYAVHDDSIDHKEDERGDDVFFVVVGQQTEPGIEHHIEDNTETARIHDQVIGMPYQRGQQKTDRAHYGHKDELTERSGFLQYRGGKHFPRLAECSIIRHGSKFAAKIRDLNVVWGIKWA